MAEFVDLVRFLSELGKVGPYAVSKARLVRRWQVLEASPAAKEAFARGGLVGVIQASELIWEPAYSNVSGVLPATDLPSVGPQGLSLIRFQLDASAGGPVELQFNSASGVTLWLDRTPVEAKERTELSVPAGVHTLTVAFDSRSQSPGLRIELMDVTGSPARLRLIGGK